MNNPLTPRPQFALHPAPAGSAGWRLWRLLNRRTGAGPAEYCAAFDRRNLVGGAWNRLAARAAFRTMVPGLRGRTVLLLGEEVRRAAGLPRELVLPVVLDGVTYRQLPHTSGRCHWYNDPVCAELAALVLEELFQEWRRST
jgi:hypothetical protein